MRPITATKLGSVVLACAAVVSVFPSAAWAQQGESGRGGTDCRGLPSAAQLQEALRAAPGYSQDGIQPPIGGLYNGERMWAAVVNRDGIVCAFVTSTDDPREVWPGSQAIAKHKAYTTNAFSLDNNPSAVTFSTARLYTLVQPGHSLFGLNMSNLFDPDFLAPPSGAGGGRNRIVGGIITFGGGVSLYHGARILGGLGISGDTACADHETAKRVRAILGLNPPGGPLADDIVYAEVDGPSVLAHPICPNTYRNGTAINNPQAGDTNNETPESEY